MGDGLLRTREKSALRLLSFALALTLLVTPALATGRFPAVNTYAGFGDVSESAWYSSAVRQCYETGLMNGTGKGNFSPEGAITVAECAAIAARLRESFTGQAIPGVTPAPGEKLPWYQQYVSYLTSNAVAVPEPTKNATRQEFFDLLSAVTPASELAPINAITALPDTSDPSLLAFYNAGILTGVDKYGTFHAVGELTRAEVATMVARITDPALRQPFIPQEAPTVSTPGADTVMTVNGRSVSRELLEHMICMIAYDMDYQLSASSGQRLDWNQTYNIGAPAPYILSAAQTEAVYQTLAEAVAEELGCPMDQLAQQLTPNPSQETLQTYAKQYGLLRAKHILCPDPDTAQAVLDGLEAVPTLDQFDALLQVFGQDPGMAQNPDGYLFSSGEMVPEFEKGTQALAIGEYSKEPVQSQFGYHIIWRLDPAGHPDLIAALRQEVLDQLLTSLAQQAQVTMDETAIAAIDIPALYNAFLATLQ